jgi:predicted phage terminase large subunit-like protein
MIATLTKPLKAAAIRPHAGPQEKFLRSPADIAIFGGGAGGGKSFAVTLEPLRHVHNPRFNALMLRRKTTQILNPGGLWEEASQMYAPLGASPRLQPLKWTFPSGATVNYSHLEHEKNKHDYQGAQIPLIVFDELTHFTESQFWYMLSRSRSNCGVRPYVRATCNPDSDSWVAKLLAWWIDSETGYPIPARSGKLRWFVREAGELKWADTPAELLAQFPKIIPKSLTFIPAKLEDNPTLCEADPGYRANLDALNSVDRARLRDGNWKIRHREGAEWPGELFADCMADYWPQSFEAGAIAIDPSKGRENGDYAAIVFVGLNAGRYYVDSQLGRWPAGVIAERAVEMFREFLPDAIGLESNANQDLVFEPLLADASRKAGLAPVTSRLWTLNNNVAKINRIYRLGPAIQRKQFIFRESAGNRVLLSQLQSFPLSDSHDDGPDALEMAVRLLTEFLAKEQDAAEQYDEVLV